MREWLVDERPWAALVVLVFHLAALAWLLNFVPEQRVTGTRLAGDEEEAIQIVFVVRPAPAVVPAEPALARPSRRDGALQAVTVVARPDSAATVPEPADTPTKHPRLDLSLPLAQREVVIPSRDVLADRGAIRYEATRFAGSWKPEGNALTELAWKSKVADVVLSAFGGPPRRCTEVEKRLLKPYCLPDAHEK